MDLSVLGFNSRFKKLFSIHSSPGLVPGRISTSTQGIYQVWTETEIITAEISGRFDFLACNRMDYPVSGDWVTLQKPVDDGPGIIHHILDRKSCLCRKAPGTVAEAQPMAANVDILIIVMGLDSDYNLRRLERYLALVRDSGAEPVVVLNKTDLSNDVENQIVAVKAVSGATTPLHTISALVDGAAQELRHHIQPGMTAAFMGSSGVGKSTLINGLLETFKAETNLVREYDGRGRHTTTKREMFLLKGGGLLIDTPGMRELQPWSTGGGLQELFADVEERFNDCKFSDCTHQTEPGCAIINALESGELDPHRWKSYLKLKKEDAVLAEVLKRQEQMKESRRWKNISKNKHTRRKKR